MLIFGYGSLVNESSVRETSVTAEMLGAAVLQGYQRKLNAMSDAFPDVAMNLIPYETATVWGVVIDFPEADMPALRRREVGYDMVDVTDALLNTFSDRVHCFIAPDTCEYGDKKAYRSYLETCIAGIPPLMRERWLEETIIECEIIEDVDATYRQMS